MGTKDRLHRTSAAVRRHTPSSVKRTVRRLPGVRSAPKGTGPHTPYPEKQILGLGESQIYPAGKALAPEFLDVDRPIMDETTPVGSMGSCFAREIKDWLVAHEFNYVQTSGAPSARHGSAAWDRVYNTFSMRQEFERALDDFDPLERCWQTPDGLLMSPYRKTVTWTDAESMEQELTEHRAAARAALMTAEVFVITLGLTEIWYSTQDGAVFFQTPPPNVFDPERHAFRVSTHAENRENLHRIHELLTEANPECTLVVTVSPVPLRATFSDESVVTANARSKATLLAAARQFVDDTDGTVYFPSYELVTGVAERPFEDDNRHVRSEVVSQIMCLFERSHVRASR